MALTPGDQLGHYKILSMIGKGGMGEVYLGTDTRLGRAVAIKVSGREFTDRFEREASAISTLNHPNICTLYDVGPNYLVLELVEGETLSKIIDRGPLPLDKSLSYAVQIVDALSAAHAKGVIHRDLKPGNIMITKNGVKVLDFGLAKLPSGRPGGESGASIETVTEPITRAGAVLGTLYYMAPEQVEGREADERSDIFSFGVVFYEMITGQRPFNGDTQAAVLASILKDQPLPMNQRQPAVPRQLERVVRKCLEKKPDDRWHSARDLKPTLELIDLDAPPPGSSSSSVSVPVQTSQPKRKAWLWPAIAAALVVALGATAWTLWPEEKSPERATRFQVELPDNVSFYQYVSVSPDGHKLVFASTSEQGGLWIHDLDTLSWRALPDTRGAVSPFWSPDSRFLGFAVGNEIKKIEIAGGPPQTLATMPSGVGSGAWNQDGVIVFGHRGGAGRPLHRVSSAGGVPTPVTQVDRSRGETFHALPSFLPDGKHFVYLKVGAPAIRGIYVGSLDAKPEEQSQERIVENQYAAPYVDGNLFFMRDGTVMTQPFDDRKLQLTGEAIPVAEHVGAELSAGWFSVSPTGVLAFRTGAVTNGGRRATWFDAQGKQTGTFGDARQDVGYILSPDGTRAGVRDAGTGVSGDIWLLEFARGVRTRFTFRQSVGSLPVWSADGTRIIFSAGMGAPETIYEKASSGAGEEKELLKKPGDFLAPTSWSQDGRFLLYGQLNNPGTRNDMWVLPLEGERKPVLLLATQFNEGNARFSPNMRWISYQSNESGRVEIYVRPFNAAGTAFGQGKWQISKDGGTLARWRAGGKQIIFRAPDGSPMAVDVKETETALEAGIPRQLFAAPPGLGDWDVTADGKRFLMEIAPSVSGGSNEPITVVLNWKASLRR